MKIIAAVILIGCSNPVPPVAPKPIPDVTPIDSICRPADGCYPDPLPPGAPKG